MLHRGERMAVNFGLLWGRAGAEIFRGALARLHRNTRDQQDVWSRLAVPANRRMEPHWLQNQLAVQGFLCGRADVRIAPPKVAFPMPRFLRRVPTTHTTVNGAPVQPVPMATVAASALCLWSGVWDKKLAAQVLEQARVAASQEGSVAAAAGAADPESRGGSCGSGAAVPGGDSRGGSCGSGGAAVPGGGSRGGSCGSGQAGPLQIEAAAAGEEAFAETLSMLHQRAFARLAEGGADLVLAHMCVSSAVGFASSGWSGPCRAHI